MSKGTQLLGTKISLISKSEIRYEGILFSLNPTESTLALAKGNLIFHFFDLLCVESFHPGTSSHMCFISASLSDCQVIYHLLSSSSHVWY